MKTLVCELPLELLYLFKNQEKEVKVLLYPMFAAFLKKKCFLEGSSLKPACPL